MLSSVSLPHLSALGGSAFLPGENRALQRLRSRPAVNRGAGSELRLTSEPTYGLQKIWLSRVSERKLVQNDNVKCLELPYSYTHSSPIHRGSRFRPGFKGEPVSSRTV